MFYLFCCIVFTSYTIGYLIYFSDCIPLLYSPAIIICYYMLLYAIICFYIARNQSSTSKKEDADVKLMKCLPSDTTVPSSKAANVQSKSGKPRKLYPCIYCKNVFTQVSPNFPLPALRFTKGLGL